MDNVTHIVLGTAIAEAGFRKRLGGKAVVAAGVLASLPDADIVAGFAGPWEAMKYHRGPTHSLIMVALAAPAFGWLLWRLAKRQGAFRPWAVLAFAALGSNAVLDYFTSYGTQLLWPVTDHRFAIDAIAIIDPAYTATLLIALIFSCLPRIRKVSRCAAVVALALTTAYLAFGIVEMSRAESLASAALEREGFRAEEVRATPLPLTYDLAWRLIARDARGDLRVGSVSTWAPREIRFIALERPESPLVAKALESREGRILEWFAAGLVSATVERSGSETSVVLQDQRYGFILNPTESAFGARALFDADNNLIGVMPSRRRGGFSLRLQYDAAWRLVRGEGTAEEK